MRTLFFIIRYMKILSLVVVTFILIGCMGTSKDIKKAESLFIQFKCTNIESTQIPHSSLNSYYEQSLYSSKKKAGSYIDGRCTSLLAYIRSPACDGSVPAALTNQSIPRF